jgi:hypothetical protein
LSNKVDGGKATQETAGKEGLFHDRDYIHARDLADRCLLARIVEVKFSSQTDSFISFFPPARSEGNASGHHGFGLLDFAGIQDHLPKIHDSRLDGRGCFRVLELSLDFLNLFFDDRVSFCDTPPGNPVLRLQQDHV